MEAYIAEGNTNKVMVTSSNTTVHNLTYKDYMEKNALSENQKDVLEQLERWFMQQIQGEV